MTALAKFSSHQAQNDSDIWATSGIKEQGQSAYSSIKSGLPYDVFQLLCNRLDVTEANLANRLGIPPATLARRKKDKRFNAAESDKIHTLMRVVSTGTEVFEGDDNALQHWLNTPAPSLGGELPLNMLSTTSEMMAVRDCLIRLEHGVYM